jgi:hypothetical protein
MAWIHGRPSRDIRFGPKLKVQAHAYASHIWQRKTTITFRHDGKVRPNMACSGSSLTDRRNSSSPQYSVFLRRNEREGGRERGGKDGREGDIVRGLGGRRYKWGREREGGKDARDSGRVRGLGLRVVSGAHHDCRLGGSSAWSGLLRQQRGGR